MRELIPSFMNTPRRCHSTVRGLMKQLRADLGVRASLGGEPCDLLLLRGEAVARLGAALAHRLAGGRQLAAGAFGEPFMPISREHAVRDPELLARVHAPALASQPLAVDEMGARKRGRDAASGSAASIASR